MSLCIVLVDIVLSRLLDFYFEATSNLPPPPLLLSSLSAHCCCSFCCFFCLLSETETAFGFGGNNVPRAPVACVRERSEKSY